jgi:hypothetical protein
VKKVWLLTIACALAPGAALAQDPTATPDDTAAPSDTTSPDVTTTDAPAEEPAVEEEAAAEEEESNWYDNLSIGAFADAYYMFDWNRPDNPAAAVAPFHRAYDAANGFNVAFVGLDLAYSGENVGATIQLRYGQGADRLLIGTGFAMDSNLLKGYFGLKQAFVSWMPTESLQIDLGQFDTIYGAEVSESYLNVNYSRSALYYLMQPFYHTGLRVTYAINDTLTLKGIVVNGINNGVDNNFTPWVGTQLVVAPSDTFQLYVGYATGSAGGSLSSIVNPYSTEGRFDDNWQQYFDVVANVQLGDLRIIGNADFWWDPDDELFAGGVSGAVQYAISEKFNLAGRVDFLFNADEYFGSGYDQLVTGTLTASYMPVENLAIRLEHRIEWADEDVFPTGNFGVDDGMGGVGGDVQGIWNATTISLVAHTN